MQKPIACAIHGGAGALAKNKYSAAEIAESMSVLSHLIVLAKSQLENGARAMAVALEIIVQMEDHPIFNAGRGSVLNADGEVEMDASVMDTHDVIAAGVSGLKSIRHPVLAAFELAKMKGHTLLAGQGAERLAREKKLESMAPAWFIADNRRKDYQEYLQTKKIKLDHGGSTVGVAILDGYGQLAAATSTGGLTGKMPGRVSDSAIIGAGTWAHQETLATSGTGTGDQFIRLALCHHIHMTMLQQNSDFFSAHTHALTLLKQAAGMGGFASVSARGEVYLPYNSGGMFRAGFGINQKPFAAIWDEQLPC
jgi:beta-aspartyl-peptidase (threonine type)